MSDTLYEIRNITHSYGKEKTLDIPQLAIRKGEILVLLGPNGAGKSTLLKILGCVEKVETGTLIWEGETVKEPIKNLALRRKIVMVLQEPYLFDRSVRDNIAYGLKVRNITKKEIDEKVCRFAELFDISPLLGRNAKKLSSGQMHRVSLARALVTDPRLLLLDEPFSSLDLPSRESLTERLRGIIRESSITSVYVTHERGEALYLADRIALLDKGRLLQAGAPEEIFNFPISEKIANFVGVETVLPGRVISARDGMLDIEVAGKVIQAATKRAVKKDVFLCIRPEDVLLYRGETQLESSVRNNFKVKIVKLYNLGGIYKVHMDAGFTLISLITKISMEELGLKEKDEIFAAFKATSVHIIER